VLVLSRLQQHAFIYTQVTFEDAGIMAKKHGSPFKCTALRCNIRVRLNALLSPAAATDQHARFRPNHTNYLILALKFQLIPAATYQHAEFTNPHQLPDLCIKVDAASAQAVVLDDCSHHQRRHAGVCQELVSVPASLRVTCWATAE
jgi:hypothetical protein